MDAATLVTVLAIVRDVALAVTVGGLWTVATLLPARHPAAPRAVQVAWFGAGAWAVAAVAFTMASYSSIALRSPLEPTFGAEVWSFLTDISLGQAYLGMAVGAVAASLWVGLVRTPLQAAFALAPVVVALVYQAITGHAAGAADHHLATSAMFVHLVGSALWLGPLFTVVVLWRSLGSRRADVVIRLSRSATWAALLVGASGVANTALRLSSPADLFTTRYGVLLTVKLALVGVVVALAAAYRTHHIPALRSLAGAKPAARRPRESPLLWRILAVDAAAMVGIVAVAVVMSGTAPPVLDVPVADPSPAWQLTGYPLPPEPSLVTWVTQWRLEFITAMAVAAAAAVYLMWVGRLRRRGDAWPWHRTASWLAGLAVLAWVTQGGPAVYGLVTFSGHMVQHMMLVMVVPVPLTLGAPVTLALRALPSRADDSRGPREWLRAFVESRLLRLLANPVFAAVNFAGSMFVFYYTPIFEWVLRNHVGHIWMALHFVAVGYFFVNALVGIDPGPKRPPYVLRVVLLFATMAFHAFFGIALMNSTALLAPRWFGLMGRDWGPSAIVDQQIGGQIAWGIGELPVFLLAIGVVVAWRAADAKETKRLDRQADRDDDAELRKYNEMLGAMGRRDAGDH